MEAIALKAAQVAVKKVPYLACGLLEAEIHWYLEHTVGLDPISDEIFNTGDRALDIACNILRDKV